MNFLIKLTKELLTRIPLSPQKIAQGIQHHKATSSKLKDVLKELSSEDLKNFSWLSTLKPGSTFNTHTLVTLRSIELEQAQKSLAFLNDKNLIIQTTGTDRFKIHESLRVFAEHLLTSRQHRPGSIQRQGIAWIDAHQKIIVSLQENHESLLIGEDIYFMQNLVWHLQQAQWEDKIHSVVSSIFPLNSWKDTLATRVFQYDAVMTHLITTAEAEANNTFHEVPDQALVQLSKYALMKNTKKLMLQSIPEEWVKYLIEINDWPQEQAMSYVRCQTDSIAKAQAIATLKHILLPKYSRQILDIIAHIKLDAAQTQAIVGIFEQLNTTEKKDALNLVIALKSDAYRSLCICNIVQHIPLPLMQKTFSLIAEMEDEAEQGKALERFIEYGTKPLKKQYLDLIQTFSDRELKVRLLSQLHSTFPQIKQEILQLTETIKANYSILSILWSLLDKKQQTSEQLVHWLGQCPSELDKVLFLSERISEANPKQLNQLWELVWHKEQWGAVMKPEESESSEALWANVIMAFIPLISAQQRQQLITELSNLSSPDIRGELCLQLFPFIDSESQRHQLYQIILSIEDVGIRHRMLSQALDDIPQAQDQVVQSLEWLANPVDKLELMIHLIEYVPEVGDSILETIRTLEDKPLQFHFLTQAIDLLPRSNLSAIIETIFDCVTPEKQNILLNRLTPKLDALDIQSLIRRLNDQIYPAPQLRNVAKQIYRTYWESGLDSSSTGLSGKVWQRPPQGRHTSPNHENEVLEEIFALSAPHHQSKVLSLYLREIQWHHVQPDTLHRILQILSQGCPQTFIDNFPILAQGIANIMGPQHLPTFGDLCNQLSQGLPEKRATRRSTENISHTFESQEFLRKTA